MIWRNQSFSSSFAAFVRRAGARRALELLLGLVLPLVVTLIALGFLVPSRLEGAGGSAISWLARAADAQPLLLGIVLFFALVAVARYWLGQVDLLPRAAEAADALGERPRRRSRSKFAAALAALGALTLLGRATLVEVHRVAGPSMAPTLNSGDRVLVNRLAYGLRLPLSSRTLGARLPRRGDLVVFANEGRLTGPAAPSSLVKRVIGLPGDVVGYRAGALSVNGHALPSCEAGPFLVVADGVTVRGRLFVERIEDRTFLTVRPEYDAAELPDVTVPPGELYVAGDDRVVSVDSRAWRRAVPLRGVEGRVSRLAFGRFRDGRLDLAHPFAALNLTVREPRFDVPKIEAAIAACLTRLPAAIPAVAVR